MHRKICEKANRFCSACAREFPYRALKIGP
uniref:Uncharacterized protein n=1 Tax=Anguilla anguilla TaxID=7936 RepID=A0A0E9UN86_ANGAN